MALGDPEAVGAGVCGCHFCSKTNVTKPILMRLQGDMLPENGPRPRAQLLFTTLRPSGWKPRARPPSGLGELGVAGWVASQRWIQSLSGKD